MSYYLQMDGVDDYLQLPSLTMDKIEIDMVLDSDQIQAPYYVIDARPGLANSWFTEQSGGAWTVYEDAILRINAYDITKNKRLILKLQPNPLTVFTDDVTVFARGSDKKLGVKGKIFRIKIYNGVTLVAHYDMSTGTVQDQSGNGKHATLYGGTWLDDGVGGGGTAHTKSLSDSIGTAETFTKRYSGFKSLSDAISFAETLTKKHSKPLSDVITSADSISKQFTAMIVDTIATFENENEQTKKAFNDSITSADSLSKQIQYSLSDAVASSETINASGGNALNLNDSITILDSISKSLSKFHSDSVSTSESDQETIIRQLLDSIGQSDIITLNQGKAVILNDSLFTVDSIGKALSKLQADSVTINDSIAKQSVQSVKLYDVIISADTINKFLPSAPELIGTIKLKADRTLYVYLKASNELYVKLKGGLDVTIENQSFIMYAGDTKNLEFELLNVDLNGSTLKWALKKSVYSVENILQKTETSGISIEGSTIRVKLDPADTETLKGTHYHELELTDSIGNVSTLATGLITIKPSGV